MALSRLSSCEEQASFCGNVEVRGGAGGNPQQGGSTWPGVWQLKKEGEALVNDIRTSKILTEQRKRLSISSKLRTPR